MALCYISKAWQCGLWAKMSVFQAGASYDSGDMVVCLNLYCLER